MSIVLVHYQHFRIAIYYELAGSIQLCLLAIVKFGQVLNFDGFRLWRLIIVWCLIWMWLNCFNCRTPYVQEQVNIGSGPPGSKIRWFRSSSNEPRFINTVSFDSKGDSPTLVMVHGYGTSQGFFFRYFDALASSFKVIAIDQLG